MNYNELKAALQARRRNIKYFNRAACAAICNAMLYAREEGANAERLAALWAEVYKLPIYNKNSGAYCEALEVISDRLRREAAC
jgi:hypothetical protein